jgi:hypothetical protein
MFNGRRQPSRGGTSRMTRECQVRFCEGLGVKFPGPTRQSRRFGDVRASSALALKADIHHKARHVSKVPLPELAHHWLPRTSLRAISRILGVILWIAAAEPFSPTEAACSSSR